LARAGFAALGSATEW